MEAGTIQNDLPKLFAAEFFGTLIFISGIFFSAWCYTSPLVIAFGNSASLVIASTIFGRYSGAHFNPVVTLPYYLFIQNEGTKYRVQCIIMIVAQYLGGLCSGIVFILIDGFHHPRMVPNQENLAASFINETFFAFMFITVIFCVKSKFHCYTEDVFLSGLACSISLTGVILYGGTMSGACYNPSTGTSMIFWSSISYSDYKYWNFFPFYLAATHLGGCLAGILHRKWIISEDEKQFNNNKNQTCEEFRVRV